MSKATKVGLVTGNKMDKTAVVSVERLVRHARLFPATDAPGNDGGHGSNTEEREHVRLGQCRCKPRERGAECRQPRSGPARTR